MNNNQHTFDVIVIGGSFAGLSAALYLARARRDVLVLDSGEPRNRYSSHSHGVFALDGQPGSELLKIGRSQLLRYHTATFLESRVIHVIKSGHFFEVETEDQQHFRSRRLILATGLVDEMPNIPGLQEQWGKSIFHCPYCDGYEIGGGPIGVIATLPLSVDFAKLITDWGEVTLFTNNVLKFDEATIKSLAAKKVIIEERKVLRIDGMTDGLDAVILSDGTKIEVKAIFIATSFRMAAPFARDLGCALVSTPRGDIVQTDESKTTSIAEVYAAGDMARITQSIPFALSDGVTAGVSAHQSLVAEGNSEWRLGARPGRLGRGGEGRNNQSQDARRKGHRQTGQPLGD